MSHASEPAGPPSSDMTSTSASGTGDQRFRLLVDAVLDYAIHAGPGWSRCDLEHRGAVHLRLRRTRNCRSSFFALLPSGCGATRMALVRATGGAKTRSVRG